MSRNARFFSILAAAIFALCSAASGAAWQKHNRFSSDPAFFGVVNDSTLDKIVAELDIAFDTRANLASATQMADATLYELNYSMLRACSDYYQSIPPVDTMRPAADAPIADQLEYLFQMKKMAKAIVGGMQGHELPDMTYSDYVRIFMNATCCVPGTFNRANHGYNFGKCDPCGNGYFCEGGTRRERCPNIGDWTAGDKSKSLDDCVPCPEGHYCPGPEKIFACPAGKWTDGVGKTKDTDCVPGEAGWYYPGDGKKYECVPGTFCTTGSAAPANCPDGTYSNASAKAESECTAQLCKPDNAANGVYCENGGRFACPNGFRYISPASASRARIKSDVCFECGWAGGWNSKGASSTWGKYFPSNPAIAVTISAWCQNNFSNGILTAGLNLCPAGTWTNPACNVSVASNEWSISGRCSKTAKDCVDCPAGYLCPVAGSWPFDPNNECEEGYWCPKGTTDRDDMRNHACPKGTWSAPATGSVYQCSASLCGAGNWCEDGVKNPCPAGYFCPGNGAINMCSPGYFCPAGSDGGTSNICPDDMWSLPGAQNVSECLPTLCEDGYHCHNAIKVLCPVGKFCVSGQPPVECPEGKYCPSGATSDGFGSDTNRPAISCPAGTWTNGIGSAAASDCLASACGAGNWCENGVKDLCPAGFNCENGIKKKCAAGYYCPAGAGALVCPDATWSETGRGDISECAACEAGFVCQSGAKNPCPSGNYCEAGQMPVLCTAGSYCDAGDRYAPRNCPSGTWSLGGKGNLADCTASECGSGNWCENGVKNLCPAGFVCDNGLKKRCEAGKYCAAGSAIGTNCPAGTWSRPGAQGLADCFAAECGPGYWCDATGRHQCEECNAGDNQTDCEYIAGMDNAAYCPGTGAKYRCPAGFYCKPGEWQPVACPAGTTSATGSNKLADCSACPDGTWSDSGDGACASNKCPVGKFSQNGSLKSCEPGQSCNNCVATNCPNGEWSGFQAGSCSVPECGDGNLCDGTGGRSPCAAGYFCPDSTTQTICPAGRFCPVGNKFGLACPAGTWTNGTGKSASTDCVPMNDGRYYPGDGNAYDCGAGNFCAAGSSAPQQCPAGTWTSNANLNSSGDCSACPSGTWSASGAATVGGCTAALCAAGNFCAGDKTFKSCPPGHTCPVGSSAPSACPKETYNSSFGLGGVCTNCAIGKTTNGMTGFSSCMDCLAGSHCPGGGADPYACPAGMYCPTGIGQQHCPAATWSAAGSTRQIDCLPVNPSNIMASGINQAVGVRGFQTNTSGACLPYQISVAALNGVPNQILSLDSAFMDDGAGGYSANCAIFTIKELSGTAHLWGSGRGLAVVCGAVSGGQTIISATNVGGAPRWRVFNTDGTLSQIHGWPDNTTITVDEKLVNFGIDSGTNCVVGFTAP
jgi:hypothetical protein